MTSERPARPPLDRALLSASPGPDRGGLPPGLTVEVVDSTPSTNALVAERARAGHPAGLVVVAEHQTAGRGRLDRRWETPPRAALVLSVLLRPTVALEAWPWLPLLTGYAVERALRARGHAVGLKWPNDVLIGERKVAGILVERVESVTGPVTGPAAVVGIGLNVDLTPEELPVEHATSLAIEAGAAPDRTDLLVALLRSLVETYDAWQSGGAAGARRLATDYTNVCVTLGRQVRVDLPGGAELTGAATAIDAQGRLVVTGEAGQTAVGAGDVVHVRPLPG